MVLNLKQRNVNENVYSGTSLVVQWLRLHIPNAGDPDSIPGQGIRAHMPQLRDHMPQLKNPTRGN